MLDAVQYLASLCAIQGVAYEVRDNGMTLAIGPGVVTVPSAGSGIFLGRGRDITTISYRPKLTPLAQAMGFRSGASR
jgi:hypothetical protein